MFPGVRARTWLVHACSSACVSAQASCTHVPRRACSHKARARMFFGVRVSTTLVHACSLACVSAQPSCTRVLWRACQHNPRARMFFDVQASTRHMHACRAVCWRACLRSPRAGSDTPRRVSGRRRRQASARNLLFHCCSIFSLTIASCGCILRLLFWNNYRTTSIKTCTNAFTRQR